MSLLRKVGFAIVVAACLPWNVSQAGIYVGMGCGRPYYGYGARYGWGPRYGWGYGGFYRPYGFGVVVAPSPLVMGAAPVVVQQPVVVQPAYAPTYAPPMQTPAAAPAPAPLPMPTPTPTAAPAAPAVMPTAATRTGNVDIETILQDLRSGDEQARADAAVCLGRLRVERAVGAIVKALNSDSSAKVREAAARGLGLIGSSSALSALQYAAQADDDREVRHSASFAAETIRGDLPRR